MNNMNSLLASVVLYALVSYLLHLPDLFIGLIFSMIGSQLNILLPKSYRTSLIVLFPLLALVILYPIIFIPLCIGFLSHIFISLLSKDGCKLLYPFSLTTFTGPSNYLENNSKEERAATTFLLVLAIIAVLFSLYGTEILSDINENQGIMNYYNNRGASYSNYAYGSSRYGENLSGYVHYVNIDPADLGNKNITTITYNNSENNITTTTLISDYKPG